MDWTEYGGQDCGATAQPVQQTPPQPLCWSKLKRYSSTLTMIPQSDYMPALPAAQVHPRTETVLVRMSTFVSHFLALLLLAEQQSSKAMQ